MEITKPIDLDRILKLASEATTKWKDSGEWFHDHRVGYNLHGDGENDENDCEYIATCDPTTITAMAQELKEAREFIESLVDPYFDIKVSERMMTNLKERPVSLKAREYIKKWGLK